MTNMGWLRHLYDEMRHQEPGGADLNRTRARFEYALGCWLPEPVYQAGIEGGWFNDLERPKFAPVCGGGKQ